MVKASPNVTDHPGPSAKVAIVSNGTAVGVEGGEAPQPAANQSAPQPLETSNSESASVKPSAEDGDIRTLQEKYSKLEARLSKQNAAVLEFENELQIYEVGVHEALLKLGIEEGMMEFADASPNPRC